jgi:hypothetical protein
MEISKFDNPAVDSGAHAERAAKNGTARAEATSIQLLYVQSLNHLNTEAHALVAEARRSRDGRPQNFKDIVENENSKTRNNLAELQAQLAGESDFLLDERRQAFVDLNTFKHKNGLIRTAETDKGSFMHLAIFAAVWLVETLVNGIFFSQTNEQGFLGGIIQAGLFAFFNLAVAAVTGSVLKFKNHKSLGLQIFGWLGAALGLFVITAWNGLIGHYRNALGNALREGIDAGIEVWDNVAILAVSNWRESMWGVTDLESAVLIALGVLLAVGAIYKQYSHNDNYPGFTKAQRNFARKSEEVVGFRAGKESPMRSEVFNNGADRLDECLSNFDTEVKRFVAAIQEEKKAISDVDSGTETARANAKARFLEFEKAYIAMSGMELPSDLDIEGLIGTIKPSSPAPLDQTEEDDKLANELMAELIEAKVLLQAEKKKLGAEQKKDQSALADAWKRADSPQTAAQDRQDAAIISVGTKP